MDLQQQQEGGRFGGEVVLMGEVGVRRRWKVGGGVEGRQAVREGQQVVASDATSSSGGRIWVGRPLVGLRAPGKIRV